jgi:hypothetical protein
MAGAEAGPGADGGPAPHDDAAAMTDGPAARDAGDVIALDSKASDLPAATFTDSSMCRQIRFAKQDYASRTGFNFGDSWMMSWGADGKTYTNFSDGKFFDKDWQTNALLTIDDDPPRIEARSFTKISANPLMRETSWAYYITNTIVVGNTVYVAMVDIAPQGLGALASGIGRSDDGGKTLVHDRAKPMWPKDAAKPFVYPTFLQNGRGYSGNVDGFMYVYGTDGDWGGVRGGLNTIRLARISTRADFLDVTKYEYYDGRGSWSPRLSDAGDVLSDGKNLGGMQSAVYNPVLRRYFLITFAEPESSTARMVLYDAPEPWGPWFRCGVIPGEQTVFTNDRLFHTAYNPSFNAKWITDAGAMWISYSNYTPQYTFHYGLLTVDSK